MSAQPSSPPTEKIALITGGNRGLGRSTALSLARRGVATVITYRSHEAEAAQVVTAARELGARALAGLGADRFDYLVNNAGTSRHNPIATTTEAELDALYNVHFKGVFFLTRQAAAAAQRRRADREPLLGADPRDPSRQRLLRRDEGGRRGPDPLTCQGARP